MKKIYLIAIVALMLMASIVTGQSTYYNRTIEVDDSPGYVTYTTSFDIADTATGTIYYTEAFKIGPFSEAYGYAKFQVGNTTTGVEDVNGFIEYANDPDATNATWQLGIGSTDSNQDAIGTTVVHDTIGIVGGTAAVQYKTYAWGRFKFVLGQANADNKTMIGEVKFIKPSGLKNVNCGQKDSTPDS